MKCALINPSGQIERVVDHVNPDAGVKQGWRWVPYLDIPRPKYDGKTHHVWGPNLVFKDDMVVEEWDVREKTPEQIRGEKANTVAQLDPNIIKILYELECRIRGIEGKPHISLDQYRLTLVDII